MTARDHHERRLRSPELSSPSTTFAAANDDDDKDSFDERFESLLYLEENFARIGHEEGVRDGQERGLREGEVIGFLKGFEIGSELGHYRGALKVWMRDCDCFDRDEEFLGEEGPGQRRRRLRSSAVTDVEDEGGSSEEERSRQLSVMNGFSEKGKARAREAMRRLEDAIEQIFSTKSKDDGEASERRSSSRDADKEDNDDDDDNDDLSYGEENLDELLEEKMEQVRASFRKCTASLGVHGKYKGFVNGGSNGEDSGVF